MYGELQSELRIFTVCSQTASVKVEMIFGGKKDRTFTDKRDLDRERRQGSLKTIPMGKEICYYTVRNPIQKGRFNKNC